MKTITWFCCFAKAALPYSLSEKAYYFFPCGSGEDLARHAAAVFSFAPGLKISEFATHRNYPPCFRLGGLQLFYLKAM